MVETEVPDGGVLYVGGEYLLQISRSGTYKHAVRAKGHDRTDHGASEDVVIVVEIIDCERATNQARAQKGSDGRDKLPHGWVIVGEDLELGVEVEGQEDEASKGGGGVTGWHTFKTVIDLLLISSTDAAVEHNLAVAIGNVSVYAAVDAVICCAHAETVGDDRLAHGEEVRAETADEPLDEDLEDGSGDERIEQTDSSVVDIPETASPDLYNKKDNEGNKKGH